MVLSAIFACVVASGAPPNPPGALADFAVLFVSRVLVEPLRIPDPVYELRIQAMSPGESVWNVDVVVRSDEPCAADLIRDQLTVHLSYFSGSKKLNGFTVEGPAVSALETLPDAERRSLRELVFQRLAKVARWRCTPPTKEVWQNRERYVGTCKDAHGESNNVVYGTNDVLPTLAGLPL